MVAMWVVQALLDKPSPAAIPSPVSPSFDRLLAPRDAVSAAWADREQLDRCRCWNSGTAAGLLVPLTVESARVTHADRRPMPSRHDQLCIDGGLATAMVNSDSIWRS